MNYFLDTEFNGFGGELLSLALVPEHRSEKQGDAYYVFEAARHPVEAWVHHNVIPVLWDCAFVGPRVHWSRERAQKDLALYLKDDSNPIIICDWPDDITYLSRLLITGPGTMVSIPRLAFRMIRVDAYPTGLKGAVQHNSWWDAMALRHKLTGRS